MRTIKFKFLSYQIFELQTMHPKHFKTCSKVLIFFLAFPQNVIGYKIIFPALFSKHVNSEKMMMCSSTYRIVDSDVSSKDESTLKASRYPIATYNHCDRRDLMLHLMTGLGAVFTTPMQVLADGLATRLRCFSD